MFGKGGGPLSAWIKEFCELVFIQTIQAFIFALVIAFIVNILEAQSSMEATDRNSALGIVCIVALTSIFKIEEIARTIFGYGKTKADHGNAVASIGKTMLAFQMGKNLLDNGKKIIGGAGAVAGAHGERVKAIKRFNRKVGALEADNGGEKTIYVSNEDKARLSDVGGSGGSSGSSTSNNRKQRDIDSKKRDQKVQLFNDAQKARRLASQEKDENKRKALLAEAKKKMQQSKAIDDTLVSSKPAVGNSGSSSGGGKIKDYNQKKMQLDDELQDKLKEINKKKRQGIKTMVSGVAETGAAMVGFTAGTAMGAASTNDWGDAARSGLTWAGTADAVTAGAVDLGFGVEQFVENRVKGASSLAKEYGKNVKAAYDSYVKDIETADRQISDETQRVMDNTKAEAESAAREVANRATRQAQSNSKASSQRVSSKSSSRANTAVRALKKGAVDTYHSHSVNYQTKVLNEAYDRLEKMSAPKKAADTEVNVLH